MTALWILFALLIVLALLFVAVPVLRFRAADGIGNDLDQRREANVQLFRQREEELRQELAEGLLNREQYEQLHHEQERIFLRDMEQLDRAGRREARQRHGKLLPLTLALLVPVLSVGLYLNHGAGNDLALPQLLERVRGAETAESQEQALNDLAGFLQARFERRPEDVQNGYMLGTLQLELGRHEDAIAVFEQLAERVETPQDKATILGQLAQARFLANDQEFSPEVRDAMYQALEHNRNEYAVMSLMAIEAFMNENFADALGYWRRQLSQVPPGSAQARQLQERIARVQELVPESELPADHQVAANAGASIEVRVDLSEEVRGQVSEDMRVFVFARAAPNTPPLAVNGDLTVADLPVTLTLDDSDAMMPQFTLSTAETVQVGARVSLSGGATAQSGDFQSVSETLRLDELEGPVELVIRDLVP